MMEGRWMDGMADVLKVVGYYWLIGCAVSGLAIGLHVGRCPNDRIENSDVLTMAAAWPAAIFGAITAPNPVPMRACEAKP
jgi:hypothetical protein